MTTCNTMTPRRAAVLRFISDYIAEHGVSPTLAEIAASQGVTAVTIFEITRSLMRMGLVSARPNEARSIRIVGGKCPTCGQRMPKAKSA